VSVQFSGEGNQNKLKLKIPRERKKVAEVTKVAKVTEVTEVTEASSNTSSVNITGMSKFLSSNARRLHTV